jgi:hypothetical protein
MPMFNPTDNNNSLYFLSAIDTLRDPVRNTRWRVLVPGEIWAATGLKPTNGNSFEGEDGMDNFALHVKSCQIPQVQILEDKHWWMGFPSHYPVNATIDASINFETILLEDMKAYEMMMAWNQSCLNTGVLVTDTVGNNSAGTTTAEGTNRISETGLKVGLGAHKDTQDLVYNRVLRNNTIRIQLYNWMRGDVILNLNLINAYPITVAVPTALNYNNAQIMNFQFTLHADRWQVAIPGGYSTGKYPPGKTYPISKT